MRVMPVTVQCELCPRQCLIEPGERGECRVRINIDGTLRSVVYGHPCAVHVDPVEKKPFFHFLPASTSLSLATVGCNLHCLNCQNWEISQANPESSEAARCSPSDLVELARRHHCQSLAYTYTDPVAYYEYVYDTARIARAHGIRNQLVTAGYVRRKPWQRLLEQVDAANIDLKALSDTFYQEICSATLQPVLDTLVLTRACGVHLEVVNLVIPTLNDQPAQLRALARWVKENLGREVPLHFSGFYPQYKMRHLPPTSEATLERAREIAIEEGLDFVYVGNVRSERGQNTYCPGCRRLLIARVGFRVKQNHLQAGRCPDCGQEIYGVWA
jgi:pyruvate formate lyase activating enzyme